MPTEREIVLAKREGFEAGCHYATWAQGSYSTREQACLKYPLPKKTVPREVWVEGYKYRVVDDQVQICANGVAWTETRGIHVSSSSGAEIAREFFKNPTIEVEDV